MNVNSMSLFKNNGAAEKGNKKNNTAENWNLFLVSKLIKKKKKNVDYTIRNVAKYDSLSFNHHKNLERECRECREKIICLLNASFKNMFTWVSDQLLCVVFLTACWEIYKLKQEMESSRVTIPILPTCCLRTFSRPSFVLNFVTYP